MLCGTDHRDEGGPGAQPFDVTQGRCVDECDDVGFPGLVDGADPGVRLFVLAVEQAGTGASVVLDDDVVAQFS